MRGRQELRFQTGNFTFKRGDRALVIGFTELMKLTTAAALSKDIGPLLRAMQYSQDLNELVSYPVRHNI
jgi:hypothetical protein